MSYFMSKLHLIWKVFFPMSIVYAFVHSIILVVVLRHMLWTSWYIVPQIVMVLVFLPLILLPRKLVMTDVPTVTRRVIRTMLQKPRATFAASVERIGLWLVLAVFTLCVALPGSWMMSMKLREWSTLARIAPVAPGYELATWLNANVEPDDQVGMFDAGVTGYFAHAHIVNLDGLVNSPSYVPIYRERKIAQYVIDSRMEYVIVYYFPPYQMEWGQADDNQVCHKLMHINQNPAYWGPNRVENHFEVMALRYDGQCEGEWLPGFSYAGMPP